MNFDLYYAAIKADVEFQNQLVRVYGEAKAGDARYKAKHEDPKLEKAKAAKLKADEEWREEQQKG